MISITGTVGKIIAGIDPKRDPMLNNEIYQHKARAKWNVEMKGERERDEPIRRRLFSQLQLSLIGIDLGQTVSAF